MRVLVTGGAGFIGSHLVDHLATHGHDVVVLDDLSSGRAENLGPSRATGRVELVNGSILDAELVAELVARVDQIFHLAAAVGVRLVNEHPRQSLRINLEGTQTILDAAVAHRTPVLLASTSEVYGKNHDGPLREDSDRILGSPEKSRWSYSEAKALDELVGYTLWKETGLPVVIARLFNTVGPRQVGRYGMVLPRFVDQALTGRPLTVYGDGMQSRCFCHVADVVPAIAALAALPEAVGCAVNIGNPEETTIRDLADRVIKLTDSDSDIQYVPYDAAYLPGFEDVRRRVPDVTRARELIGFEPRHDLDGIITAVVQDRSAGDSLVER